MDSREVIVRLRCSEKTHEIICRLLVSFERACERFMCMPEAGCCCEIKAIGWHVHSQNSVRVGVVFCLKALFVERGDHLGFQLVWGWHQMWADQSVRPHVLSYALFTPRWPEVEKNGNICNGQVYKTLSFLGGFFFPSAEPSPDLLCDNSTMLLLWGKLFPHLWLFNQYQ